MDWTWHCWPVCCALRTSSGILTRISSSPCTPWEKYALLLPCILLILRVFHLRLATSPPSVPIKKRFGSSGLKAKHLHWSNLKHLKWILCQKSSISISVRTDAALPGIYTEGQKWKKSCNFWRKQIVRFLAKVFAAKSFCGTRSAVVRLTIASLLVLPTSKHLKGQSVPRILHL